MRIVLALLPLLLLACSTLSGDPAAPYAPDPLGSGLRIAQVQDPSSKDYHVNVSVSVTSAVATWVDTFDETHDGKSIGTLFIQDIGSNAPYSGVDVYEPDYVPASLTILPGDVLDFVGPYQQASSVGSATFDPGTFLPQLEKPVGTFRYEFVPPPVAVVTAADLEGSDANFNSARKWENMLVTINDVVVAAGTSSKGRVTYLMGDATADGGATIGSTSVAISNEEFDLDPNLYPAGTRFKSVTGLVTWFYTFHVAPRSAADLVLQTQ
jgi:hypothetical protein